MNSMFRASYLSLVCGLLLSQPAQASEVRSAFKAALAAAEAGATPGPDSEALRNYALYPYLQAARLRRALRQDSGQATDTAIAEFLTLNSDLLPARELRRAWLDDLAGRQQWTLFMAYFVEQEADAALRCHRLRAWQETGGSENLREEALRQWMTGEALPQACTTPFRWLQESGELTPERKEQRARLALAAGNADLAEWLLQSAPPERVEPLRRWIRLLREPRKELRVLASRPELEVEWDALREAYFRMARGRLDDALEILPQLLQRPLTAAQRDQLRQLTAQAQAWERRPGAMAAFRELPDGALDSRGHEWRVRAALWQGDWPQALDWLARMPAELAAQPRWQDWRARALEATGQADAAAALYRRISGNHWFALLAAHRSRVPYRPQNTPSADVQDLLAGLVAQPSLVRARELFMIDRIEWANREWLAAIASLTPQQLVQVARLAAGWGWTLQAAATWKRAGAPDDLDILYPQPDAGDWRRAAESAGLTENWLYAIARQESLFLPRARSTSDALGLLQVKLDTARDIARRVRLRPPQREDLFDPATNLQLGAHYFAHVLQRYQGRFLLAVASYNAGPNAVARWLTEQPVEADVWIESIPYNETRDYVGKVLWNAALYQSRVDNRAMDVSGWLSPITAKPPS
jgi:soluble lytic murein transglycosylase